MTPATWLLSVWICAGPGAGGECAPSGPVIRFESLRACRAEAVRLKRENPSVIGRCRKQKEEGEERSGDGPG